MTQQSEFANAKHWGKREVEKFVRTQFFEAVTVEDAVQAITEAWLASTSDRAGGPEARNVT